MAFLATFLSKNGHIGHQKWFITPGLVYINQGHQILEFDMLHGLFTSISISWISLSGHFLPKNGHFLAILTWKWPSMKTPLNPCKLASICPQRPLDLGLYLFRFIFYHHFGMAISSSAAPFKKNLKMFLKKKL